MEREGGEEEGGREAKYNNFGDKKQHIFKEETIVLVRKRRTKLS